MQILGRLATPKRISPEKKKIQKLLKQVRMPRTLKQIRRLLRFALILRSFIPKLGMTLLSSHKLLKNDTKIDPKKEHFHRLEKLKAGLLSATETFLRLPEPGMKYVLLCPYG